MKDNERQWKAMKGIERQRKTIKYIDIQWKTMNDNERQWETGFVDGWNWDGIGYHTFGAKNKFSQN